VCDYAVDVVTGARKRRGGSKEKSMRRGRKRREISREFKTVEIYIRNGERS
jgi:hypothetical protein